MYFLQIIIACPEPKCNLKLGLLPFGINAKCKKSRDWHSLDFSYFRSFFILRFISYMRSSAWRYTSRMVSPGYSSP